MRVCMLAYTFYEGDNRVRRYGEALAKRGDAVDVIALKKPGESDHEVLKGVNLYRIQKRVINEKGKFSYLFKLVLFLMKSFAFVTQKHLMNRYDLIHIHSIPDFEVFAALVPKLTGAKIILDIHDIVPELYISKFKARENTLLFKMLTLIERYSVAFSDHVIISNHIWKERLLSRCAKENKCSVFLNYPDTSIFHRRTRTRNDQKFIMIYPGTLNWHQGVDVSIKAFGKIQKDVPNSEFHIYGRGPEKEFLMNLAVELDLKDRVLFKEPLPLERIADVMADADLGVVPKRNDRFGGEAFSTKIFEFMALGVPVIASKTKIDKYYFNDSTVKYFEADDENDLAQCMLLMFKNRELRENLVANASRFVEQFTWDKKKGDYISLVTSLTSGGNCNLR